jgi:hypothetical protein
MDRLNAFGQGLWNILVSLDQLGNVLLGTLIGTAKGDSEWYGEPDETISSVLGRKAQAGVTNLAEKGLVKGLDWLDKDHVMEAIEDCTPNNAMLRCPRR